MRRDVEQSAIQIGVPAYQQAEDVTLGRITRLPFAAQRDDWKTIEGETRIERAAFTVATLCPAADRSKDAGL
jgi:hypothetical protein